MGLGEGRLQGHPAVGSTQHLGAQGELQLIDQGFAQQAGRQLGTAQHQQALQALGGEPLKQTRPRSQRNVSLEPCCLLLALV